MLSGVVWAQRHCGHPGYNSPLTCYHPWGWKNIFHLDNPINPFYMSSWVTSIPYQHALPEKTLVPSLVQAGAMGRMGTCGLPPLQCVPQKGQVLRKAFGMKNPKEPLDIAAIIVHPQQTTDA